MTEIPQNKQYNVSEDQNFNVHLILQSTYILEIKFGPLF